MSRRMTRLAPLLVALAALSVAPLRAQETANVRITPRYTFRRAD